MVRISYVVGVISVVAAVVILAVWFGVFSTDLIIRTKRLCTGVFIYTFINMDYVP
ncbi:hypothetical protein DPMN_059880 [Dreissena polymorpha]|uniref:Uncharacterized protein n=1 Tax=Dreissena polymorpha TaxID=45954 RepID=A0A9D4C477_DREPO|nr:hypothetical protein DPMN_059880 [Dreissena polymorpha]